MWILVQKDWRNHVIFAAILLMPVSLLLSRVTLNINLTIFLLATLFHHNLPSQLRTFIRTPLTVAMSCLFLIPFVSGMWSSNIHEWALVMRVKLPLLLFPLAFAGDWRLTEAQWKWIARVLILTTVAGCCWSLAQYAANTSAINEAYLSAKTLPTPLDDDHVRFSWLVSLALACSFLLFIEEIKKGWKFACAASAVLFLLYLHILSARTGIAMSYILLTGLTAWMIFTRRKNSIMLAATLVVISLVSWFVFPSLQNRLRYNRYDLSLIQHKAYVPGTSDGNRMHSLKAGWHTLQQHPFGVGAGDVKSAADEWYANNIPQMLETDKLYPSSEWIVYGNFAGWPGLVLFSIIVLVPLWIKNIRHRFFWIMLNCMSLIAFVLETSLEIQFGVFIYCFFVLWWWKWLSLEKKITLEGD